MTTNIKREALVIVDAWKNVLPHDDKRHPHLSKDTKAFGVFLNRVCELQRSRGTVIMHSPSAFEIMEEIEIHKEDVVVPHAHLLPQAMANLDLDKIYFGGFHFGRCIQLHAKHILPKGSIVLNLSLTFPSDLWIDQIKKHQEFRYSLWNTVGFEDLEKVR